MHEYVSLSYNNAINIWLTNNLIMLILQTDMAPTCNKQIKVHNKFVLGY